MTLVIDDADFTLYVGDVLEELAGLQDDSIHCVVTSPPYWGLRDYGTGEWEGGDPSCRHVKGELRRGVNLAQSPVSTRGGAKKIAEVGEILYGDVCGKCGATRVDKQLGLEATPAEYVAKVVEVFRAVRRVLRPDGIVWLNLGDSYSSNPKGSSGATATLTPSGARVQRDQHLTAGLVAGLKPKDLVGVPWRVAFALQEDGWWLRSDVIWEKTNPMPESVTDRPTSAHEYLFLLAKSARYFYDADAIREPHRPDGRRKTTHDHRVDNSHPNYANMGTDQERWPNGGRNRRTVWLIATESYRDAHFATFPQALVEPCVKAGTSEHGCCSSCGTPWARDVEVTYERADGGSAGTRRDSDEPDGNERGMHGAPVLNKIVKTLGWYPLCTCGGGDLRPIYSPLGEDGGYDPTLETGRAGLDRPRAEDAGTRRTTRHEQAAYAKQLRKSPARPAMEEQAGAAAFAHYLRTDGSGARPIPEMFLEWWIGRGWLTRVEVPPTDAWPPVVPCTVLDPFMGSGTTALVARRLGRRAVGVDLNEEYAAIAARRLGQQSLFG